MKNIIPKISVVATMLALLANVFLPCFSGLSAAAATYRAPYAQYVFNGNLNDSKGNSHLTAWSASGDDGRSNATTAFGEDSNGSYWQWHSNTARGGGFYIDFDKNIGAEYTIGLKFSFENTMGGWRKIIDYLNSSSDTGFYFYNGGHLNFYNYGVNGTSVTQPNQVIDLIVRRNASTKQFEAYLVQNGKVSSTPDMSVIDNGNQGVPSVVVNGGSRLGFFFDDIATNSEASPGGKVYNLKIWDRYLDPQDVVDALLPKGYVNVRYIDDEGDIIIPDVRNSGDVDSPYEFTAPDFYGYEFIKATGDPTKGVYPESDEYNITFNYKCLIPYTVTARYVDEAGNKLCDDVIIQGEPDKTYNVRALAIEGYDFVRVEGSQTGTFVKRPQLVTFIYKKSEIPPSDEEGTVKAMYVDEDGNEIIENILYKGYVYEDYKTSQLKIPGYTFKQVVGSETGKYSSVQAEVKYIYTKAEEPENPPEQPDPADEEGGSVIVHYKNEDGYIISPDVIFDGNVGTDYAAEQKEIYKYVYKRTEGEATGKIENGVKTVTLIYAPLASNVVARYVDENDIQIENSIILSGAVGDPYTTEKLDFPNYRYVKTEGEPTGVFSDEVRIVKYVYGRLGQVEIQYKDVNGKQIKDTDTHSEFVNEKYSFTHPEIYEYKFIRAEGNETGVYTREKQVLRYIYKKIIVGTVIAHYVDDEGYKIIPDDSKWGEIETPFEFTAPEFYGYEYIRTDGIAKGDFVEGESEVSFIYKLTMPYTVTARYVDKDGNKLCDDIIYKAPEGTDYKTGKLQFAGYDFVEVIGEETGKITRAPILVTYVYEKQETPPPVEYGEVTAVYQDEDGETLHSDMNYKGVLGTAYKTGALTIPGYVLKETVGIESDVYTADKRTVKYIYAPKDTEDPIGGSVIVKYRDENDITLLPDEIINGLIGDEYHAVRHSISGYAYVRTEGVFYDNNGLFALFRRLARAGDDPENGEIEEEVKTVILYYEPLREKTASTVIAHYVDTDGNTLHFDNTYNGFIGETYRTEAEDIDGWKLFEIKGEETGEFTDELQSVTYVYKKAGKVVVKVVDEDGNVLEEKVIIGFIGEEYDLDEIGIEDIDGYEHIVIPDADKTGEFTDGTKEIVLGVKKLKTPDDNGGNTNPKPDDNGNNNGSDTGTDKGTDSGTNNGSSGNVDGIDTKTGDNSKPYLFVAVALLAVLVLIFGFKKLRKNEK